MKQRAQFFPLAIALMCTSLVVGCSSTMNTSANDEFACQESKNCPTPLEVYGGTNNSPIQVRNGRTPESWKPGASAKGEDKAAVALENLRMDLVNLAPAARIDVAAAPPAKPLREPSQVMRIWVAPWVDQSDNLNWAGYIYTEVTTKRWAFGEQEVRHQGLPPQFFPR